jgi:hypothetical protein
MSNRDSWPVLAPARAGGGRQVRVATLASLVAIAACSADRSTAPAPHVRPPTAGLADLTPSATEQLLYQQPPNTAPSHTLSPPVGSEVAADFTVPTATRWHITRVVALASEYDGTVEVKLYQDGGGFPSTTVLASTNVSLSSSTAPVDPCCGTSIYDYSVPITLTVDAGRYWVSLVGDRFFMQLAPTVGLPMLIEGPPWLTPPSSSDVNDLAFYIYGTVETVSGSLAGLHTTLTGLNLDAGTLKSFLAKLRGATDALNAGDKTTACKLLQDLINAVNAVSGKKLTTTQAGGVITDVRALRSLIGC